MDRKYNFGDQVFVLIFGIPFKYVEGKIVGIYCGPDEVEPQYSVELYVSPRADDMDEDCELVYVNEVFGGQTPILTTQESKIFSSVEDIEKYVVDNLITTLKRN